MQIIEASVTGVRSAVITLQRGGSPLRFVLFPMIHLGSPAFYQEVTGRLERCQLVVAEGIGGRWAAGRALTLAYRLPGRGRRLGLAVQHIDFETLGVPVIRPDMTAQQFRRGWRAIPVLQRLAVVCIVPPLALAIAALGTRRFLARHLAQEDLPSRADQQLRQSAGQLTELILDRRDALLVDALSSVHQARSAEQIDVAVVWGAAHMPAVSHQLLARYGYRPRAAEWLTVFDY